MINWKARLKNPIFWATSIPAALIAVQCILAIFGITWDYHTLSSQLLMIADSIFAILAAIGVVTDMTTSGFSDSKRAMEYDKPYRDGE